MSTDPTFLWLGEKHREALAILKYAILENKGVLALTGDVGTGKTTLINALLKSLGEDTITATIYDPRLGVLDFFNTVAAAFQMETSFEGKGKFILGFMDFLIKAHEQNRKVLLIIDEAQGINEDLLEEIRLLSNLEAEYTRLLNIFFVGQNEFVDILQKYENRALRQRVTIRYHIEPLSLNETAAYIKYRLEVGGTTAPIFDSGAIDEVFFFSGGYPRLINIMCDHALLSGYVREVQVINANLIRECREELLVSKKTSENDFQYSGNDYRSLPSETMFSDSPADPFVPAEDSHVQEDAPMAFIPSQPVSEPIRPRKPPKKRFFRSSIALAFILVVGLAAGYFFYGNDKNTAESFVSSDQQRTKKYFPATSGSKDDKPPTGQAGPEASDIPGRVEAGKVGDSRYYIVKSPESTLLKETAPKEAETPPVVPSKRFPEESGVPTDTSKPGVPEPAGNDKTIQANAAGASNISPESAITKPVATVPSSLRQQVPVTVPTAEKTRDEIQASAQMPSKIQLKSPGAAAAPADTDKKKPVTIPAPKTKPSEIQTLASKPVQVHAKPKTPATIKTKAVKPVEKPETVKSITEPVQAQKKTSERYRAKTEVKKKKEPESAESTRTEKGASSLSSGKQAPPLAAIPLAIPPKETVISKKDLTGEDKVVSRKKAQPARPVPDEKKAVNRVDEKVVSLRVPAGKSETAGSAGFTRQNLYARLKVFLNEYCRIYEQKDLDKFSTFFALNAVEKGKPFRFWLSKYRQNFDRIDSIEYDIELERYATQEETGLVKIDGIFHVRAKLGGSKEWRKSSGEISMVLEADGNSFKVMGGVFALLKSSK